MADTIAVERDEKTGRRARILGEAERVFFEQGYEGACIDEIIKRVGGSKRTIYNEFGSKEGLFAAMIADTVSKHSNEIIEQLALDERSKVGVREALIEYAKRVMALVNKDSTVALFRTAIGETNRFPKLAKAFYESGPGRTMARFAEVLEHFRARGEIRVKDCALAAELFGGLIRDSVFLAVLLGVRPPLSGHEIDHRAEAAVDLFLNGTCASPRGGGRT